MITLPTYRQTDDRWAKMRLLPSNFTMGDSGCYITSLCMGMHNYAITQTPAEMCKKLNDAKAFDKNGFLNYDGLSRAYPQISFRERVYTTNDPSNNVFKTDIGLALKKIQKYLMYGQPVVLCVDAMLSDGVPDHAVVAYKASVDDMGVVRDFWVHDPGYGEDAQFSKRYGDPWKKLYGYIAIIGSPIEFNIDGQPGLGQTLYKLSRAKLGENVQMNVNEAFDTLLSV